MVLEIVDARLLTYLYLTLWKELDVMEVSAKHATKWVLIIIQEPTTAIQLGPINLQTSTVIEKNVIYMITYSVCRMQYMGETTQT